MEKQRQYFCIHIISRKQEKNLITSKIGEMPTIRYGKQSSTTMEGSYVYLYWLNEVTVACITFRILGTFGYYFILRRNPGIK